MVRDHCNQEAGATGRAKPARRRKQFFGAQIVLLEINTSIAIDLRVEERRREPLNPRWPASGLIHLDDDPILADQPDWPASQAMPTANFILGHPGHFLPYWKVLLQGSSSSRP